MRAFDTLEQLNKEVESRIKSCLKNDLPKMTEKILQQHAKKDVHRKDSYKIGSKTVSARSYDRSIENPKNIVSEVEADTLFTRPIAKPESLWPQKYPYSAAKDPFGTAFAEMINDGSWVDLKALAEGGYRKRNGKYHNKAPKREARPFVSNAQQELIDNSDKVLDVIRSSIEGKLSK